MQRKRFFLKVVYLGRLCLDQLEFAGQIADLELEQADVLDAFLVLDFALAEGRLEDLDLLVEEG